MGLASALYEKCISAADAFIDDCLHFTVAEAGERGVTKGRLIMVGDFFREVFGSGAGEKFDFSHGGSWWLVISFDLFAKLPERQLTGLFVFQRCKIWIKGRNMDCTVYKTLNYL